MYSLLREMLFCFPPEKVHYFSMNVLQKLGRLPMARKVLADSFTYNHPSLVRNCMGLSFRNPVGLGAGFDKNALYLPELAALGFEKDKTYIQHGKLKLSFDECKYPQRTF